MTKEDLRKVFQKYGTIIYIKIIVDKLTGENKGFAYISFSKASEAAYALEECDPSKLGISPYVTEQETS